MSNIQELFKWQQAREAQDITFTIPATYLVEGTKFLVTSLVQPSSIPIGSIVRLKAAYSYSRYSYECQLLEKSTRINQIVEILFACELTPYIEN